MPSPSRVYFKPASPQPIMTREEEAECASRIAQGDAAVFTAIASSPYALAEVVELGDRIESGDLFEIDITVIDRQRDVRFDDEEREKFKPTMDKIRRAVNANRHVSESVLSELRLNPFAIRQVISGLRYRIEDRICNDLETASMRRVMAAINAGLAVALKARNELVIRNPRLVTAIAKKHLRKGLDVDDLIQEGSLGLMRAAEKFSNKFNVKFSTYAGHWIDQSIIRAIDEKASTIRVPVGVRESIRKLNREMAHQAYKTGASANFDDAVSEAKVSKENVRSAILATKHLTMLDAPFDQDDPGGSAHEVVASPDQAADETLSVKSARATIEAVLSAIPPREATILRLRFGVDGKGGTDDMTLDRIGKMYNLSRERIRQLEVRAMKRMREPEMAAMLADAALGFGYSERMVGT